MTQSAVHGLLEKVREVGEHGAYHRLILLVGAPRGGKTTAMRALATQESWPLLNLNLELSQRLLDTPVKFRPIRTLDHVRDLVSAADSDPVLLDNIELLFQRELEQDPLQVLLSTARTRTLVVAWPGEYVGGALSYAAPGHPEQCRYASPECAIITVST